MTDVTHESTLYAVVIKRGRPVDWFYYKFLGSGYGGIRIAWATSPGNASIMAGWAALSIVEKLKNGEFDEQMEKKYREKEYHVVEVKVTHEVKLLTG